MRVPDIAREARYDSIRPFVSCGAVSWSRRLNFNETGAELTRRASQLPGPMFGRSSVRAFWPLASVRVPATVPLQTTWIRARTPLRVGRERALEKAFVSVKPKYDYILIDTPPSLGLLTINALVASNGVIVPVQCEYLSLRGLVQLENTLSMIRENLNPEVEIQGILPTMFDKRLLHSKEAVDILKENFGDLVFNTKIRKTVRYAEAPVKGQSVLGYDPTGDAADLYRELAKEVLNGAKTREHA